MGRRSYSGEKRRKELDRKAKRDAKLERKQQAKGEGGTGPPIDWDAMVGSPDGPPPEVEAAEVEEEGSEEPEERGGRDPGGTPSAGAPGTEGGPA